MADVTTTYRKPAEIYLTDGTSFTARHVERKPGWLVVFEQNGDLPDWYPSERVSHVTRVPEPTDTADGDSTASEPSDGDYHTGGRLVVEGLFEALDFPTDEYSINHVTTGEERYTIEDNWNALSDDEQDILRFLSGNDDTDATDIPDWVFERIPRFGTLQGVVDNEWQEDEESGWQLVERRVFQEDLDQIKEVVD